MIAVDLAAAARDEARRLTEARALIAASRPFVADGPLVGIARRRRLRVVLGRRMLLLYRCADENIAGRVVHSTLVAIATALEGHGRDVRRWSDPSLPALIDHECRVWRAEAQRITSQFTITRLSRERAMASNHAAAGRSFQPGLFDRRAHRLHIAHEQDAAAFAERVAARIATVEAAGTLMRQAPELLLVLIPRDAAGV